MKHWAATPGCNSSVAYSALAAVRSNLPPAIAHSDFEAAKEFGWFDIESCGDLDQSANVWTSQAAFNQADRSSICVHFTRQTVLRDIPFLPNLSHYLAQLLLQTR
jgi:hypothetical protein